MKTILRDALLALLFSLILASAVNAFRAEGLDWIAKQDYQILVPCPEPIGKVEPITPGQVLPLQKNDLLIDSRLASDFETRHAPGAIHLPYDFLTPVSQENLQQLIEKGARRIIVVGDGQIPDSGEELAKELSGQGIKNVFFIPGGFSKLQTRLDGSSNEE